MSLSPLERNNFYWKRARQFVTFYTSEKEISRLKAKKITLSPRQRIKLLASVRVDTKVEETYFHDFVANFSLLVSSMNYD